jgi:aryl-alcohol dehydrogenase-like predicted oxidoreductase
MGRRADPHVPEAFTPDNLRRWNDRSRDNLGDATLDLVQLHCPPTPVYSSDAVFETLDEMVSEGRMRAYGVSVETVEEALTAIAREHVASVQIILNVFRRKPLEEVLAAPPPRRSRSSLACRSPRACSRGSSGPGRRSPPTTTAPTTATVRRSTWERRSRGCPYDVGVEAARRFAAIGDQGTPAQRALRWIIDQPGVTTVIPGASRPEQAVANAGAAALPPTSTEELAAYEELYDELIRGHVHHRW